MNQKLLYSRYMAQELVRRYRTGERDFSGLDLSNIYLYGACLIDINFSRANLKGSYLQKTTLINTNLSYSNLEQVSLSAALLINANLKHTNLRNANLIHADLTGADLTGADLTGADLNGTALIGANLTGANLTDIKTTQKTILCPTIMPDSSLLNDPNRVISEREMLRLYAAGQRIFLDIVLHQIDLSGSNLRDVSLGGTHLSYVNFSDANLENSSLGKAILCDFRNARLSQPEDSCSLEFIYCDLRGANLVGVDMSYANLTGSNLQGAKGCLSGGIQGDIFFCNTTWTDGEFIPGPINATEHWGGPCNYEEF